MKKIERKVPKIVAIQVIVEVLTTKYSELNGGKTGSIFCCEFS